MKLFATLMIGLASLTALSASAGELDAIGAPQGLIVREDAQGNREVFKADVAAPVTDSKSAEFALKSFVKPENLIKAVKPSSELDQTTSEGAWYSNYNNYYYSSYYYSYYYSSYSYNYYPCYGYSYGGYSYYYYSYNYSSYYWY
jgi:hypothetical protein